MNINYLILCLIFSIILNVYIYNLYYITKYNLHRENRYKNFIKNNVKNEGINIKLDISKKIQQDGVFATKDFKKNELIEICPCLDLNKNKIKHIEQELKKTMIYDYWWIHKVSENEYYYLIALGYLSCINHSRNPNVYIKVKKNRGKFYIYIYADRYIKKDEELFDSYGGSEWFTDRNIKEII